MCFKKISVLSDQTYLYDFSYKKRVDYVANLFSKKLNGVYRIEIFGFNSSKKETDFDKDKVTNFTYSSKVFGKKIAYFISALRYKPPYENTSFLLVENLLSAIPLLFCNKINFHLDLHGDVVDELRTLRPRTPFIVLMLLRYMERKILLKASSISVCSENHKVILGFILGNNYKSIEVIPNVSFDSTDEHITPYVDKDFNDFRRGKKVIVYAGSGLPWQRPEDMLLFFKILALDVVDVCFLILTNDIDLFKNLVEKNKLMASRVLIKSVHHENIRYYYKNSDFGIIFRDYSTTNLVACPTKLMEYALMGLPIIYSGYLGDFKRENAHSNGLIEINEISDNFVKEAAKLVRSAAGLRYDYNLMGIERI
jgi:glycosyltransferase involved in cell wall biosynthesis